MSDSDFIAITNNGALCNDKGQLGPAEFERLMREQMLLYTQSRLSAASEFWNVSDQVREICAARYLIPFVSE